MLRKNKGISQTELAEILGVTFYTVSSYECGRSDPDDKTKIAIAEYFDVSIDYLLGLIDEPLSYKSSDKILIPKYLSETDKNSARSYIDYLKNKNNSNTEK